MKIRVDEIPDSGRLVHVHWTQDRLERLLPPNDPQGFSLARPLNVDLEIHKKPDHIEVTGTLEGQLTLRCDRCLEEYASVLKRSVRVLLFHEVRGPKEEEVELEPDELEYEFFDGEIIEVDRMIAEEVFLELPMRCLCSETCRGLCAGCGANLNRETCTCQKTRASSPFDVLKSLTFSNP
ncbi:YceD family protein [Desulfosoma caldarium]|uniref:DUF177 domain-containing protein n=1 Tax=Desulfosoma caldarium TaxID=610254 RepID=A0A3N1UPG8_9BACT|nr:DUF177 domain-containing protein [Desulfosoma caldarium]ROQ90630.1 uncharacterized protein EDC27_2511 [Desulfosoma caldarium]